MTASTIPTIDSYAPGIVTRAPEGSLSGSASTLLGVGIVAWLASLTAGMLGYETQFYFSYLVAYMFTLSLALGALFFVMVQHVSRAGWSIVVRRLAENMANTLPFMAVLFFPIALGQETLFHHWIHPVEGDEVLAGKAPYLNLTFFYIRVLIYFVVWVGLARFFCSNSAKQDATGDPALSMKMARFAAPGIVLFGFTITFAAFDWMMSLNPHWFSTMFGVTYFAGSEMAFLALLAVSFMWLSRKNLLKDIVNAEHYHDIGKLMFAFMVFWAYVNFSQYFLIHYADLPEETAWYADRNQNNWPIIGTIIIVGHFLVPFAFLLSRHMKRNRTPLAIGALLLLAMHWIDMQYVIMPNHHDHFAPHWLDLTTTVGVLCIFLGLTLRSVARTNLIPVRDPKLKESINFVNF